MASTDLAGTTNYELCIYSGDADTLIADHEIPAGMLWRAIGDKGYKFNDPSGASRSPFCARAHRRDTSQGVGEAVAVGIRVGMQVASSEGRITGSVSALFVSSISSI